MIGRLDARERRRRRPARRGRHDRARGDAAGARLDADGTAVLDGDAGDLRALVDVDAQALRGRRVAPDDGVVADHGAGRVVGGAHDRVALAAREIDLRAEPPHLVRVDEHRVDPEGLVQQRALALQPQRVLAVRQPEQPRGGTEQVVVELLREPHVEVEALFEERDRLRHLVIRSQDGRVAARRARSDVAALEHADVRDPVARGEVVGGREAVPAAADDDDVVARARLA